MTSFALEGYGASEDDMRNSSVYGTSDGELEGQEERA